MNVLFSLLTLLLHGDQDPIETTFKPLTIGVVDIRREQAAMSKETLNIIVSKDKYEPYISLKPDTACKMMS